MILEHAERYGLSAMELAHSFLISPATAYRWLRPPGSIAASPLRRRQRRPSAANAATTGRGNGAATITA
jgi:transposase